MKRKVQANKRKVGFEAKSTLWTRGEPWWAGGVGSSRLPSWPSDVLFIIGVIVITVPFVIIIVITIIIITRSCAALWRRT